MVHVNFDPDSVDWNAFFQNQKGGGYYFEGAPYQRGYGIGGLFANLFRYLLPVGKIIGEELGREGLALGSRVLGDISSGANLKNALSNQTKQGLINVIDSTYDRAQTGRGKLKKMKKIDSIIGKELRSDYNYL